MLITIMAGKMGRGGGGKIKDEQTRKGNCDIIPHSPT